MGRWQLVSPQLTVPRAPGKSSYGSHVSELPGKVQSVVVGLSPATHPKSILVRDRGGQLRLRSCLDIDLVEVVGSIVRSFQHDRDRSKVGLPPEIGLVSIASIGIVIDIVR